MKRGLAALALAAPLCAGCGQSLDEAVFVEMGLGSPSLTLTVGSLATKLDGHVELSLHLGPNADRASDVTLETASLEDAAGASDVLTPLYLAASPTLPLSVAPDSTIVVTLTIDGTQPPLEDAEVSALCADAVRFGLVLRDSRQGSATPLSSEPIVPAGCP